jgi:hypothetical protein
MPYLHGNTTLESSHLRARQYSTSNGKNPSVAIDNYHLVFRAYFVICFDDVHGKCVASVDYEF